MIWQQGQQVGPYEIVEQIGSGGMATVYRAYQPKLDRDVALKVMHQMYAQDDNFRARFEREARIVASLDHPAIVPIYDFDEHNQQPYLVVKLIEGQTLKRMLRKGALKPAQTVIIMLKIADALTYAHERGVLHRDVKPSNILIDPDGRPYLTDFGLARLKEAGESTQSVDTMLGTPHYVSPEQASGNTELSNRTDVYSFGVVLYELTTGRVPFMNETTLATIHDHIYSQPSPPREVKADIPPGVEVVLLRALAKNPDDRYPTPNALMEAYQAAMEGSVITAPAEQVTPRTDDESEVRKRGFDFGLAGVSRPVIAVGNDEFIEQIDARREKKDDDPTLTSEERIRRRVEKRMSKGREALGGLFGNLMAFLFVNFVIFNAGDWINAMISNQRIIMPDFILWFTFLGWGFGLIGHFFDYWNNYGPGRYRRQALIDREVEREYQRLTGEFAPAKRKNDAPPVRLTGDGELSESFIEETKRESNQS